MTLTESIPTTVLALLLACLVLGASPAAAAQFDTSAQTDDRVEMSVEQDGDTVTVTLSSSADDVAGFETNISFDSSVVEFVDAEGIDLPDPVTNADNDNGWIFITQAQGGGGVDQPTLTKLTFEVVSDGTSEFDYDGTETGLFDSEGKDIPVEVSGTSVDVSSDSSDDDSSGDDSSGDDSSGDDGGTDGSSDGDSSDQESGSSDGGDDGQMNDEDNSDQGSDGTSEGDDSSGDESEDESTPAPESDSSLISGIGLLAVVAGFLFAVAILARGRM